ncbi:MAG: 2-C-methyl-D-erythritol 4-phosphate cytidylyltransferase [Chitinophagaceae bacterium BSSC1]|nr:MAG: 2-C-methyl-D-erythritol 4-phosphate cytidylyltransferase [Chitinophagaceae bacterium BSSC1]
MRKYAVIVAGGSGLRMGADKPKQFLLLRGKPILYYTILQFFKTYPDIQILLVLPKDFLKEGQELVALFDASINLQLVTGGATRFHSVLNGLKCIKEPGIVFVHDGVRCLLTSSLIKACYEQALVKGSAIPAVAATDSIRIIQGASSQVADRNLVRIIQTPQTFQTSLLLPAFDTAYLESFTDEATVLEAAGEKVHLIEGDYNNIKITRPVDLLIAENILKQRESGPN